MVDTANQRIISSLFFYSLSLQWSNMIFSVSNDDIEWFPDFGFDSVTLTVQNFFQQMRVSSQKIPLAAWSLLLSQKQDFMYLHLARVPITSNQEVTREMRDEVFSSVGGQHNDRSGFQVSDLDDVEVYCGNDHLDVDVVSRTVLDTPFSPSTFIDFEISSMAENLIPIDEMQAKENCPPLPATPVSQRPIQHRVLKRSCPIGTRIQKVPDYVYRNLLE